MDHKKTLVSVCMITYNHEKYIRQAIEGALMQQTNFPIEIVIGEDCSTDRTREICIEYKKKYPDIIKLLLPEKNLGVSKNFNTVLKACNGKYIALCEGDDYWIDSLKLQKQVDFLETHPDYVYSCHRFNVYEEDSGKVYLSHNMYFETHPDAELYSFSLEYPFLKEWITQTLTSVVRKDVIDMEYYQYFKYYRDVHLIYDILSKGKGVCHSFIGAVRCENSGGIFAHLSREKQLEINYKVYKELYIREKSRILRRLLRSTYSYLYLYKDSIDVEKLPFNWFKCEVFLFMPIYYLLEKKPIFRVLKNKLKRV